MRKLIFLVLAGLLILSENCIPEDPAIGLTDRIYPLFCNSIKTFANCSFASPIFFTASNICL